MVERTIKVVAPDGETIVAELSMQDGGLAAELKAPTEWHTPETLDDIATACTHMAALIRTGGA